LLQQALSKGKTRARKKRVYTDGNKIELEITLMTFPCPELLVGEKSIPGEN
jgi:hypothetical protein